MTNFLIVFTVLSLFNVIFSTARSLVTMKGGKWLASLASGAYFSFYNIMLIYTVADFPLWQKCLITFICNVVGVYLVKWGEEKTEKTKLWKIEISVLAENAESIKNALDAFGISRDDGKPVGKWVKFDTYCYTKEESAFVKKIAERYKAKYFASASESL